MNHSYPVHKNKILMTVWLAEIIKLTKELTIYALRNDTSSYLEWNDMSTGIDLTTQRQAQELTPACSSWLSWFKLEQN